MVGGKGTGEDLYGFSTSGDEDGNEEEVSFAEKIRERIAAAFSRNAEYRRKYIPPPAPRPPYGMKKQQYR